MSIFKERRPVWTSAIFFQREIAIPPTENYSFKLASLGGIRHPTSPHTKADPFLFEWDDRLFIFVETQVLDDPGCIQFSELSDSNEISLQPVLVEPFHVSYPHVFDINGDVYMLPETTASGEVRLYKFLSFPEKLIFYRSLIRGNFTDPSPVFLDGVWFVFMTSDAGLELFYTDDLVNGDLVKHPCSPITNDARYYRSAGVPFYLDGKLIRPAQNCINRYGENVNLIHITKITTTEYSERVINTNIFKKCFRWNKQGGHHLHVIQLLDKSYAIAVDGQSRDSIINKFLARLWVKAFR